MSKLIEQFSEVQMDNKYMKMFNIFSYEENANWRSKKEARVGNQKF
jgi:hypothetical protein